MTWKSAVDRYFHISERGSSVGNEIKSGVVTFLTASYILLVNPQILGAAGLPVQAVVSATALTAAIASLVCGLTSNLPVCISPGMGLNAYLVYSQVLGLGVSANKALAGCLVAAGVVALLAVLRALNAILAVVPNSIKLAVVVGMGLLLSFIGLQTSQIVVADAATMVTMGDLWRLEPALAIGGLAVIAALHFRNVRGSIIIGVAATAGVYCAATDSWPTQFVALPHLELFKPDFSDLFTHRRPSAWSAVLAYTLVMVFDIGGAMFGLCNLAGLLREGRVPGATWTYLAAAGGTALGAVTGTTPLIIAAESAVGIKEGGRTGLVAVTVSGCFVLSMFLAPLLQAIPQLATAPVLVLVGAMMMGECTHIDWSNMLTAVPAFLTIVIQPFTFSIANGIYAGLVMALLLHLLTGQFLGWLPLPALSSKQPGEGGSGAGRDLESPLLGGTGPATPGGGGDAEDDRSPTPARLPAGAAAAGRAIPIDSETVRRALSRLSSLSDGSSGGGGGGGGRSYERASFVLYTNTSGSLPRPGSLTRGHGLPGPRASAGGSDAS